MVTRMEITACPVCGSKNIGIGTLGDGIISGLSSWKEVCKNCGYQGASLIFESEADYNKFHAALSYQRKQQESQAAELGDKTKEQEDKQTTDYSGSNGSEKHENLPRCSEKKNYTFELILSVVLSIVFFIVLYSSRSNGLFSQNDFLTQVLNIISSIVSVSVFFFLFIVLVEMIYRSIRRKKT
jgi:transcription elongation factor Elf1